MREDCRVRAQCDDPPALRGGPFEFLADMRRGDRLRREHQDNKAGFVDRPNDLAGVEGTRHNIPRGYPASQAAALQDPDDGVGDGGVL